MLYYLGKGTELKKENCKEYKTIKNVLIAASKDESLRVWDETGKLIEGLTDNVQEEAAEEQKEVETEKSTTETETCVSGADTKSQGNEIIIPQETTKVTVVCDGTLNLRRSANWGNDNICGRASKGQSYYVKAIHTVQGKKMVQTIDDIYLSGQSEHVKFEQM